MWRRFLDFVLGEGPKGSPPERVRWLIVEQQVRSEILIGWVQFALVLFFLVIGLVLAVLILAFVAVRTLRASAH